MIDTMMGKLTHIKHIIAFITARIDNSIRHDFSFNNRKQSVFLGVFNCDSKGFAITFQNTKDSNFTRSSATAFAFTLSAKITFIQLNGTIKNFVCLKLQIVGDNLADFSVKQHG